MTIKNNLTTRLESLITRYPECPWLKELIEWDLKERASPSLKITISNSYFDTKYDIFISEN